MIYHGTPMTPRAALNDVCAGRGVCVSFYRPDDVDAVEKISPSIMYDNGAFSFWKQAQRAGQEWAGDRDWTPFLSLAGVSPVSARSMGGHPGHSGGTIAIERCAAERVAIRSEGRTAMAHGRADQPTAETVRAIRPSLPRLDRRGQGHRLSRLSFAHGGSLSCAREYLAGSAHDARNAGVPRLPLLQRGQHLASAERMEV